MKRAVTLIELLVVIAIIMVLAGMIFGATTLIRQKAREVDTTNRMQNILMALSAYEESTGSRCLSLQEACSLGGALRFARLNQVNNIATNTHTGGGGATRSKPKPWTRIWDPIFDSSGWRMDRTDPSLSEFEVVPPGSGPVSITWYETTWRFQWPETDWTSTTPGANPPILRFPWGAQPMLLNGRLADASKSPDEVVDHINSGQNDYNNAGRDASMRPRQVYNSWVAMDASAGSIWQYSCRDNNGAAGVSYCINGNQAKPNIQGGKLPASTVSPIGYRRSHDSAVQQAPANQPLPFDLGYASPLRTIALLQAAEVLPAGQAGLDAYRSDRVPSQTWNDAWGNPLVVAYALYQPERCGSIGWAQNYAPRRHFFLQNAKEQYGHTRALYLTVGAVGKKVRTSLPNTWTDSATDATVLRDLWLQIRDTAEAHRWTEQSWSDPAWSGGMTKGSKNGETSFVATPITVH
ncbi:MAG: type II secretion system protein [Planctomycetota bacterium]|jgi:type II secretory pathway pseudopilin PulG|nr:type II secretion system protein [Planctomycetota bacterium]